MTYYLWISKGERGDDTRPILASADQDIILQVIRLFEGIVRGLKEPGNCVSGDRSDS